MARGGVGSTVYLIGLVFSILVSVLLLFVAYQMNTDATNLQQQLNSKNAEIGKAKEEVNSLRQEKFDLVKIIVGDERQEVSPSTYQNTFRDAQRKAQQVLSTLLTVEGGMDQQLQQRLQNRIAHSYASLDDIHEDLLVELEAVINVIPRLQRVVVEQTGQINTLRTTSQTQERDLRTQIANLQREKTRLEEEKVDLQRQLRQEQERLQRELDQVRRENANQVAEAQRQLALLTNTIQRLQQRIDELVQLRTVEFADVSDSDGEVVFADAELGFAWIDVGAEHGLRRGLVFQVFQFIKGGRRRVKGFVEVLQVQDDMSQVAILENYPFRDPETGAEVRLPLSTDPIVKGDLIQSPLFDREERQVFVFLGTGIADSDYDREELERKIEEAGGRVDPNVTIETDYVIALEGYDQDAAQYDTARQFGVVFMRIPELLDFLGRGRRRTR